MPNRSRQANDEIANLDLRLTDLRAHFEAQLRTVRRAEECLLRCRHAQDAVAFEAAADTFRDQCRAESQDDWGAAQADR